MIDIVILLLNLVLLGIGLTVVLTKRSIVFILIGIELIIQAAISNCIVFNNQHSTRLDGQVLVVFATAISICEIVMILAISLQLYHKYKKINLDENE